MKTKVLELIKNVNVKKTAIYVGCVLLLIIMALYVRKKINEAKEEKAAAQKLQEYNQSIEAAIVEGGALSYSEADYKIMADQLFVYLTEDGILQGGLMGVNQKGIYAIMEKMNTDADVYKLIEAFGTRELRAPYALWGKELHTLPSAFAEILFKSERNIINEILTQKGLKNPFV